MAKPNADAWQILDESTWMIFGLVVALLAMAYALVRIRAWFRDDEDEGLAGGVTELLGDVDEMRRSGALTETEYRSIQSRLSTAITPAADHAATRSHGERVPTDGKGTGVQ
jgi:hypothetical protein